MDAVPCTYVYLCKMHNVCFIHVQHQWSKTITLYFSRRKKQRCIVNRLGKKNIDIMNVVGRFFASCCWITTTNNNLCTYNDTLANCPLNLVDSCNLVCVNASNACHIYIATTSNAIFLRLLLHLFVTIIFSFRYRWPLVVHLHQPLACVKRTVHIQ